MGNKRALDPAGFLFNFWFCLFATAAGEAAMLKAGDAANRRGVIGPFAIWLRTRPGGVLCKIKAAENGGAM